MNRGKGTRALLVASSGVIAPVAAGCGGSGRSNASTGGAATSTTAAPATSTTAAAATSTTAACSSGGAASATGPNRNFTRMAQIEAITAKGKGGVGAILPDTVPSTSYVELDAPYLATALQDVALSASQFSVVNAHGSGSAEYSDAQALFKSGKYADVSQPAGTWARSVALPEFQQQFTAHANMDAVLMPNGENGAPISKYLQTKGIKPKTFPVTGQDATLTGLGNILTGYQCGTVYKPIHLEAQAAAVAIHGRVQMTPPSSLLNGTTEETQSHVAVKPVLLAPEWVTPTNIKQHRHRRQVRAGHTTVRRTLRDCGGMHN